MITSGQLYWLSSKFTRGQSGGNAHERVSPPARSLTVVRTLARAATVPRLARLSRPVAPTILRPEPTPSISNASPTSHCPSSSTGTSITSWSLSASQKRAPPSSIPPLVAVLWTSRSFARALPAWS